VDCDGNNVFQGSKTSVTTQMKELTVPFVIGMHCFVHQTNLTMLILSNLSLVVHLEALYGIFFHTLKKNLKLKKLCDVFTKKGNKLL